MAFRCTAFEGIGPQPRPSWECSPEELHRRRQEKYDELWGESVGDQLAKGWADPQAQDPQGYSGWAARERQRLFDRSMELAAMWDMTEAELEAEEGRLP